VSPRVEVSLVGSDYDGKGAFLNRGHVAEDHSRLSAEARELVVRKIIRVYTETDRENGRQTEKEGERGREREREGEREVERETDRHARTQVSWV
jgi:hypothetical protein